MYYLIGRPEFKGETLIEGTKKCSKCGEIKSLGGFYKSLTGKNGINSRCKDCLNKSYREYYRNNYRRLNRVRSERRLANPIFRLSNMIGRAIAKYIRENNNGRFWEEFVGYTMEDLRKHLELQFAPGMNWSNYGHGGWTMDHKIPICLWKFESYQDREFKQCWALANIQPLWSKDNLSKGTKIIQQTSIY